ncbi:hypothetical protein CURTO8I2_220216 [Curtobacterium sp. 8I-2]|nr:hypothetical protein CURTO8I2_220216 [Curtobacterium sp. 8I-2]
MTGRCCVVSGTSVFSPTPIGFISVWREIRFMSAI